MNSTGTAPTPLTHRQVLVVYSGLLLAMLLAALDSTIVATALPTVVAEFGGLARLSWVVTAYLLAQTVVTPLYGKLGDLYGRKRVLQTAIVIFLIGSALCGISQSLNQLIVFRVLQGLGGGGLMVTTQAVVGDIISPKERGRYQGIFGAVFGVSSITGPLLGGYFTTHLSWRWIFYINLPLGLLALVVLAITLPRQAARVRRSIDYIGASTLALSLSSLILLTDLAGTVYRWSSPQVLGLLTIVIGSTVVFILTELRAEEPVLPLRLFRNRAFWVTSCVGLVVGFALFGVVTNLPLFLQVVKGSSPTASGMQMLPLMGGMLFSSITSGQLISRTGRYKVFPIAGTAIATLGLFLLSRMAPNTSIGSAAGIMLVIGLGLGMVMQVLVIAVQNSVDYSDLGVATSGTILFRFIGGAVGTAVLGTIFAAQLATQLPQLLPEGSPAIVAGAGVNPQTLSQLPDAVRNAYAIAFSASLNSAFLVASLVAFAGFLLAWLLPEHPLRETIEAATEGDIGGDVGRTFSMPADADPLAPLLRGLAVLVDRDVRRQHIQAIVDRAGVDLSPAAAWLLIRLEQQPGLEIATLARQRQVPEARLSEALEELHRRQLIRDNHSADGRFRVLSAAGCDVHNRLVAARRARLDELFAEWSPEQRSLIGESLQKLAVDLIPQSRPVSEPPQT